MGWINQGQLREASGRSLQAKDLKQAANDSATAEGLEFGFCEKTAQTSDLPFISPDTVAKNDGSGSGGRLCELLLASAFMYRRFQILTRKI